MAKRSKPTLFVADDERDFRSFVRKVAEDDGWEVVECVDGVELLDELERNTNDGLILLDMLMPRMDGIESIVRFNGLHRKLPICMITGGPYVHIEAANLLGDAEGLPIVNTLFKPIKIDDLLEVFSACRNGEFQVGLDMWSVG